MTNTERAQLEDDLTVVLYLLMRDFIPTGQLEKAFDQLRALREDKRAILYSSPHLQAYASHLARELVENTMT